MEHWQCHLIKERVTLGDDKFRTIVCECGWKLMVPIITTVGKVDVLLNQSHQKHLKEVMQ